MGDERTRTGRPRAASLPARLRPTEDAGGDDPAFGLQQQFGNQAVTRWARGQGGAAEADVDGGYDADDDVAGGGPEVAVPEEGPIQGRTRSNAVGAAEGKQQFIEALMADEAARSLKNHIPSTGMGRFDAEYQPIAGVFLITVRPYLRYEGTWDDAEKQDFEQQFRAQAAARWSDQHQIVCTRPGWEDLAARVVVDVEMADDVANAHFDLTVRSEKRGMTALGREQFSDPSRITTGMFARSDAPERPHDSPNRSCELAMHDAQRIDRFLAMYGVAEVSFDEGGLSPEAANGLRQAVTAINGTALPAAVPVPVVVTGFDTSSERGVLQSLLGKDKAKERADAVGAVLAGGLGRNPVEVRTIRGTIDEARADLQAKVAAYEEELGEVGGRPSAVKGSWGYGEGGVRRTEDEEAIEQLVESKNARKVTVSADEEWARAYRSSDPYSILAHEFGHMLGNPDEYFGYGPELINQRILNLASSGDEAKVAEAYALASGRQDLEAKNQLGDEQGQVQARFASLVSAAGQDLPEMTVKGNTTTSSIMNAGTEVLGAHYATIWEALGKITSRVNPALQPGHWRIQ